MNRIIVANFKMNGTINSTINYGNELFDLLFANELHHTTIVLAPSVIHLAYLQSRLMGTRVHYAAQDLCGIAQFGPHTGNISGSQLADLGCQYCIIGHSERRQIMGETDCVISKKIKNATVAEVTPILCVGENLNENRAGDTLRVIQEQLTTSLEKFDTSSKLIIAYEPVWSIGTGKVPGLQDIQNVFDHINWFIDDRKIKAHIIYGGSVNSLNVSDLLMINGLSGFLVGGASLKVSTFWPIVQICEQTGNKALA